MSPKITMTVHDTTVNILDVIPSSTLEDLDTVEKHTDGAGTVLALREYLVEKIRSTDPQSFVLTAADRVLFKSFIWLTLRGAGVEVPDFDDYRGVRYSDAKFVLELDEEDTADPKGDDEAESDPQG